MSPLSDLLRRIRGGPSRDLERQIESELEAHLEMLRDEYISGGLDPEAAEARARRRFGSVARYRAEGLEVRGRTERRWRRRSLAADFMDDLRFALRGLWRAPTFAAVTIGTLALAIGANTAVFSVVDAVLLRPLPYTAPDRLAVLYGYVPPRDRLVYASPTSYFEWRERSRSFEDMAYLSGFQAGMSGPGALRQVVGHRASANFFDVLGVEARVGRMFVPGDESEAGAPALVLSHVLWTGAFGSDPGIVGEVVRLEGEPHTVVGVAPAGFSFDNRFLGGTPELWVTEPVTPELRTSRGNLLVVGRLRDGVTLEQAQAEMVPIAQALAEEYPELYVVNRETGAALSVLVAGLHADTVREARPFVLFAMAMAGLVLLIACLNVANLLMARSARRRRELAVRTSMGAGRMRVARQLLTESAVLAGFGGICGLFLARVVAAALIAWGPHPTPGTFFAQAVVPLLGRVEIDTRAVGVTLVVCALATGVFGGLPAIRATSADPLPDLKATRPGRARPGFLDGRVFVAVELAVALVLLIGVGLLGSTFHRLQQIPLGFTTDDVTAMTLQLPVEGYLDESGAVGTSRAVFNVHPRLAETARGLVERLAEVPGVEAVGVVDLLPFRASITTHGAMVHVEGARPLRELLGDSYTQDDSGAGHVASQRSITPGLLDALGIPLLRGRDLAWSDNAESPGVVLVDQALAEWYWPGEEPIGKRMRVFAGREWRPVAVVGLVRNARQSGYYPEAMELASQAPGLVYYPYAQTSTEQRPFDVSFLRTMNVVVRHDGDDDAIASAMRAALADIEPSAPISVLEGMDITVARSLADRRFHLLVIGISAGVALIIALIGVYGVFAFQVGQRVHEIGVRRALGAEKRGVVRMIVVEGVRVAVLGALLGVAVAMAGTRVLIRWLYEVTPTEPAVFAGLTALMISVAVLACWIPARRAARVDPVEALRVD